MTDMVRINHGLRPKYEQQLPSSGFALLMDKIGVLDDNVRRSRLFKEREQQLFQTVKALWNTHHNKIGDKKFSDKCRLEIQYKSPEFPVDPKTKKEDLMMEQKLLDSGDSHIIKKLYPHLEDVEVNKLIKSRRKDKVEQLKFEAQAEVERAKILQEAGIFAVQQSSTSVIGNSRNAESSTVSSKPTGKPQEGLMKEDKKDTTDPKIDNRAKHSENSSKQPNKNGDQRK